MNGGERFSVKEKLLLAEKGEDLFVLDIETGKVHRFNHTAKVIFRLAREALTLDELVMEYARLFSIDMATAREDALTITEMMRRDALLRDGV